MEYELLDALEEKYGNVYAVMEEALLDYSKEEILNAWLEREGIIGYANKILSALNSIAII